MVKFEPVSTSTHRLQGDKKSMTPSGITIPASCILAVTAPLDTVSACVRASINVCRPCQVPINSARVCDRPNRWVERNFLPAEIAGLSLNFAMSLVSGPGRGGGLPAGKSSGDSELAIDRHVEYIKKLDTVRTRY